MLKTLLYRCIAVCALCVTIGCRGRSTSGLELDKASTKQDITRSQKAAKRKTAPPVPTGPLCPMIFAHMWTRLVR